MTDKAQRKFIYVVNSSPRRVTALADLLSRHAIGVRSFSGGIRFAEMLRRGTTEPASVVVAADTASHKDRWVLQQLVRLLPHRPVIVLSDEPENIARHELMELGAADVIETNKPFHHQARRILDALNEPA